MQNSIRTDDPLAGRLLAATALAREAGQLAARMIAAPEAMAIEFKGPQDVVTQADRDAEAMIISKLNAAFSEDDCLGEESGGSDARQLWIIDPIDGTANFARGMPYWSVVIAYAVDGVLQLGVTYDPISDEVFSARRGHGAWRNGTPIRVNERGGPDKAVIGTTFIRTKMDRADYTRLIDQTLAAGADHRRMGSTALMLAHVADGRIDGCVAPICSTWDIAAGLLLVREAGGMVNDFIGDHGMLGTGPMAAGTQGLQPFLEEISGVKIN